MEHTLKDIAPLQAAGLSLKPNGNNYTLAGYNDNGSAIYSPKQLLDSKDINIGNQSIGVFEGVFNPLGVLSQDDKKAISNLKTTVTDPMLLKRFDDLKGANNHGEFLSLINNKFGTPGTAADKALYSNWSVMSPSQKSLALSAYGMQSLKMGDKEVIPATMNDKGEMVIPGVNATAASKLFGAGYNVYGLKQNWPDMVALHEIADGRKSPFYVANTAKSSNLLGAGVNNAAVPGVSEDALRATGYTPVPRYGIGAVASRSNAKPPTGYAVTGRLDNGAYVYAPQGNAGTSVPAVTEAVQSGVKQVHDKWEKKKNLTVGTAPGGSQMAAGLSNLSNKDPMLFSGMVSYSLGKKGLDDVDYLKHIMGTTLSRIASGDRSNVSKLQPDVRSMKDFRAAYGREGISSKSDGYQLTNQGFAEGRFTSTDTVTMQKVLDMVFDNNGPAIAQSLIPGRDREISSKVPVMPKSKEELQSMNRSRYSEGVPANGG